MPDEIAALNTKMDFLIGRIKDQDELLKEQGKQITALQRQFDQSKGALGLIKTAAWLAGIGATVWAALHLGK